MLSVKEWHERYLAPLAKSRSASQHEGEGAEGPPKVESSALLREEPNTPRSTAPQPNPGTPSKPGNIVLEDDLEAGGQVDTEGFPSPSQKARVQRKIANIHETLVTSSPRDVKTIQHGSRDVQFEEDAEAGSTDADLVTLDTEGNAKEDSIADITEGLSHFHHPYDDDEDMFAAQEENLDWKKLWDYDKKKFFQRVWQRAPYYVFPIALWLPRYQWKRDLLSDIIAGIGVGCMLVPQALAYATIAGVPPVMGLYSAFFPLIIFAAMTSSKHMHFGPDALASLLVGLTMLGPEYIGQDKPELASIFACISGLTLLIMGVFRFGFLDNILSRPLLSGFVNAVAAIIFVNQLEPFLGLPPLHAEQAWQKIAAVFANINKTHILTLLFGLGCLSILIVLRVLKWRFPDTRWLKYLIDTFIIVVIGVAFSYGFDFQKHGVQILGAFPATIPVPEFPKIKSLAEVQVYYMDAVIICIIGFVESILAVKIYANKHNYTVSPNRELVAMGTANFVGSFFHTYPAFGSLTRSAVADFLGAKSQLYAFVSAIVVLITILLLGPVVYFLPRVTMSAIIMIAAYSLVELHDLVFLWSIKAWKEIILLVGTFVITIVLGVDLGIFIGIGISLFMVVAHTSVPHITILGKDSSGSWIDASKDKDAVMDPVTLVVRIEEALYFANIEQIKDMFKRIEFFGSHHAHPTAKQKALTLQNIVVHCKNITDMDASAIQTLAEMTVDYQKRGVFVCFVKPRPEIRDAFLRSGIVGALGGDRVFKSVDEAITYSKNKKNS